MKLTKKLFVCFVCLCAISTSLCACTPPEQISKKEILSNSVKKSTDKTTTFNYTDGAIEPPLTYNDFSSEVTDFELKLFKNFYSNDAENNSAFTMSPVNTVLTLGLIANGSDGKAQNNILNAFGTSMNMETMNQCASYLKSRLTAFNNYDENTSATNSNLSSKAYVNFQNSVFINDEISVRNSFLQNNADFFGFDIFRLDFSNENLNSKIDNHFKNYTEKSNVNINKDDCFVVANAMEIYDQWLNPYSQNDVKKGTFYSSTKEKEVTYMTSNESYLYSDKAEGIIKYTLGTPLKFLAIMPKNNITLADYISELNYVEYSKLLQSFNVSAFATASIPEFSGNKVQSTISYKEELSNCGLSNLFTEDISLKNISLSDDVFINDILEITPEIKINANGISGKENVKKSNLKKAEPIKIQDTTIDFSKPFIFMMIDNESDIPLYIGVVDF